MKIYGKNMEGKTNIIKRVVTLKCSRYFKKLIVLRSFDIGIEKS